MADGGGKIFALKVTDNQGVELFNVTFGYNNANWHIREIPEDQEIIGFYCNNSNDYYYMKSLGFITWKPNSDAIE